MLKTTPAVFAVGDEYQIMVVTEAPCLFWVRVGDCEYFDESNGILRSLSDLHRVCVPMSELDREKAYTVCVRPIVERKPYFTETENVRKFSFAFRPVGVGAARAYHISDIHKTLLSDDSKALLLIPVYHTRKSGTRQHYSTGI